MPYDLVFGYREPGTGVRALALGLLALPLLLLGRKPPRVDPRLRKTVEVPYLTDEQLLVSEVLHHPEHRDESWATELATTQELPAFRDN